MTLKYVISLFFLLQIALRGAGTLLTSPGNVTIESVNLETELRWLPAPGEERVEYTVQYQVTGHPEWLTVVGCAPTRSRRCNLTADIGEHLNVTMRVRASRADRTSPWSRSKPFCAQNQTRLGPPNVTLYSHEGKLQVRISDPFHRNSFASELKHRVYYRKDNSNWEVHSDVGSALSIDSVEAGLNYCVQAHYVWFSRLRPNSVPSLLRCAVISESDLARAIRAVWVTAAIAFLVIVLLVCVYAFTNNYGKLKKVLQPPLNLPEHQRKFLMGEEQLVQFPESSSNSEEHFDKISLVNIDEEAAEEEEKEEDGEEEEVSSTPGST
ncbi:hypothetical protein AAFF_G00230590 [Aldrovandia affinis]|uniref:Fibronectin type-III domain-containing protein n=1 Tax=Aldrovandia affinis TaxID=143900 RepID=A0AAD7W524_9TELE|nr:hypothetical protein AAFF_G00230590 [Aldrovandia affinis]